MAHRLSMLEKNLIAAINKRLPKTIHHQSMTFGSISQNGTPDRFYDGPGNTLWVEFKQLKAIPCNGVVVGSYSELQLRWLERRYNNSLPHVPNAVGIVGLPNRKAVIQTTPTEWREGSHLQNAIGLSEVSTWILDFCFRSSA